MAISHLNSTICRSDVEYPLNLADEEEKPDDKNQNILEHEEYKKKQFTEETLRKQVSIMTTQIT